MEAKAESRGDRLDRLGSVLTSDRYRHLNTMERLCAAAVDELEVSGASLSLTVDDASSHYVCGSNAQSARMHELELVLGEGPSGEACRSGRPVLVRDLGADGATSWVDFAGAAVEEGARAFFALPLPLGGRCRIGALNLYRDRSGELSLEQLADAEALAHLAMLTVVGLQREVPEGELHDVLWATCGCAEIHQATGVMAARLGITPRAAFSRLRAHAFSLERSLVDVASEVVQGRFPTREQPD